jgi:hypothetical protein
VPFAVVLPDIIIKIMTVLYCPNPSYCMLREQSMEESPHYTKDQYNEEEDKPLL